MEKVQDDRSNTEITAEEVSFVVQIDECKSAEVKITSLQIKSDVTEKYMDTLSDAIGQISSLINMVCESGATDQQTSRAYGSAPTLRDEDGNP